MIKTMIIFILVIAFAGCASTGNKAIVSVPRGEEGIQPVHAAGGLAKAASGVLSLLSLNPMGLLDLFGAVVAFDNAANKTTVVEVTPPAPASEE